MIADRSPLKEPLPQAGPDQPAFVSCDLASAEWDALLRDGDVVHHYACSTIPKTANDEPLSDLDVNVRGTLRLLDALRRRSGIRLIFPSSGGTVYGPLRHTPVGEEHSLDPITIYGVSKVAIEKYLGFYRAMHGLDVRIARLSNPYGVGQDPSRKQGAATTFVMRALAGEPIEVWGDGSVIRDYIHISDAVAGLLAIADAPADSLGEHPVFNIGSGKGVSIAEILQKLEERVGGALRVTYSPSRGFDIPCNVLDIGRARSVLGWTPKLTFDAGMDLMIDDYRSGRSCYSTLLCK